MLEQLLTSGGGWQDQQGGIFHGVKLLESDRGFIQKPLISWLPDYMFTDPVHASCHFHVLHGNHSCCQEYPG